jgi:hypothetical protein
MDGTITGETKNEGQKTHSLQEPKKKKQLIPLVVRSYLTHNPYNVACKQIVRFKSNGRSRTSITLPFYSKG